MSLGFTLIFIFNSLLYNEKMMGYAEKMADQRDSAVLRAETRGFLNVVAG